VLDLFHETLKFDMFPITNGMESQLVDDRAAEDVKLGKRSRGETMKELEGCLTADHQMLETYVFIYLWVMAADSRQVSLFQPQITNSEHRAALDFCLQTIESQGSYRSWRDWFLAFKVQQSSTQLSAFLDPSSNDVILTNHSKQVLRMLTGNQETLNCNLQDRMFVLQHVHQILTKSSSWDICNSHQVVFMVLLLGFELPKDLVKTLEAQNGQAYLEALMVDQEEMGSRFRLLETIEKPWISLSEIEEITRLRAGQEELK
jgi:hypothetical protein